MPSGESPAASSLAPSSVFVSLALIVVSQAHPKAGIVFCSSCGTVSTGRPLFLAGLGVRPQLVARQSASVLGTSAISHDIEQLS